MFKYICLLSFGPGGNNDIRNEIVNATKHPGRDTVGRNRGQSVWPRSWVFSGAQSLSRLRTRQTLGKRPEFFLLQPNSHQHGTTRNVTRPNIWNGGEAEGVKEPQKTPEVALLEDWDLGAVEEKGEAKPCPNIWCKKYFFFLLWLLLGHQYLTFTECRVPRSLANVTLWGRNSPVRKVTLFSGE